LLQGRFLLPVGRVWVKEINITQSITHFLPGRSCFRQVCPSIKRDKSYQKVSN
jgi:hypothetical protein